MRRFRRPVLVLAACLLGGGLGVVVWLVAIRQPAGLPKPLSVPSGDQEVAWINNTTGGDTWALFVIGVKRAEMPVNGVASGLSVDDSKAFPEQSTAVPEVVVTRAGHAGKIRIRWYKVAAEATIDGWVQALADRTPAPLAVIGGWTSDRAHELAQALARQPAWRGDRPLLLVTTATVDTVLGDPDDPAGFPRVSDQPNLIEVYAGRSFRFCFSNAQMVRAVTDFVLQEPTLHPGPAGWPRLRAVGAGATGPWGVAADLADLARRPTVFPLEWQDDPYSGDLYNQFREHLYQTLGGEGGPRYGPLIVRDPAFSIPFSVGGFSRPNHGEAAAVRAILRNLPPPGERSLLVVPTVSNPTRRVLLALAERVPQAGRRLVAVTGDGLSVNTFYRDAEWAWPARSIPIPLVLFAHDNPFGWDAPGDQFPPPGYRLEPKNTTEEVLLYTTLCRMLSDAAFPAPAAAEPRLTARADEVAERLRTRPDKFFDDRGNRRGLNGEHVVVVRPTVRYGDSSPGTPRPDATIEVYRREVDGRSWTRVGAVQVHPDQAAERSPVE
ncbi:MAG: hypothetical protein JWO38_2927 [Gemmataceae bacterium]|nr:hypothetical protein [Gemmataceae bacterium]